MTHLQAPPAGWYTTDDVPAGSLRWWNGEQWTGAVRSATPPQSSDARRTAAVLTMVASVIGFGIAFLTPVNLLSGMGMVWFGAVLAFGAAIAAYALRTPVWCRVTCTILAVLGMGCAGYDMNQLEIARQNLQDILTQF